MATSASAPIGAERTANSCWTTINAARFATMWIVSLSTRYATVPVYEAFFRWLGYGDRIDEMAAAWKAKDREGAVAAAPWEVIEDTFIFGTPEEMRERLEAFVAGGITLPILTPITTPDKLGELIGALAPT